MIRWIDFVNKYLLSVHGDLQTVDSSCIVLCVMNS